jgi:hypothetical protein
MHPETLRQLAQNCRRKDSRFLGFPRDWNPGIVENPQSPGFTFSEFSAWEYIADLIEAGHPYEDFKFDNPAGAVGIEIKVDVGPNKPKIYIKLQLGKGNRAIGRSFHYSDFSKGNT